MSCATTACSGPHRRTEVDIRGSVAMPSEIVLTADFSSSLGIGFCCCVRFLSSASQAVAVRQILSSVAMVEEASRLRMNLASCSGCNGDTHILTFAARSWRYWRRRSRERANLSVSRPLRRLCELVENFFFSAIGASWGESFGFVSFFLIFFLATVSHKQPRFSQR